MKTNKNKSRPVAAKGECFQSHRFLLFHLTEKKPFDPELWPGKAEAFFQRRTALENTTQMKRIKILLTSKLIQNICGNSETQLATGSSFKTIIRNGKKTQKNDTFWDANKPTLTTPVSLNCYTYVSCAWAIWLLIMINCRLGADDGLSQRLPTCLIAPMQAVEMASCRWWMKQQSWHFDEVRLAIRRGYKTYRSPHICCYPTECNQFQTAHENSRETRKVNAIKECDFR